MKNEALSRLMTKSPHEGGCGMSLRPEFYSGLGWSTLDVSRLVKIYRALESQQGYVVHKDAADHFVQMVMSVVPMSATDFLTEFHRLDANDYYFKPSNSAHAGIDLGSDYRDRDVLAEISVRSVLDRHDANDEHREERETYNGVLRFLKEIGREADIKKHPLYKAMRKQRGEVDMCGRRYMDDCGYPY